MATTLTTGGAISGYCAIGSERIADKPAITKKIDSTAAKIGRSMKKRENMAAPYLALGLFAPLAAAPAGAARAGCTGAPGEKKGAPPAPMTVPPPARPLGVIP